MSRFLVSFALTLIVVHLDAANALPVLAPANTTPSATEQVVQALFVGVTITDTDNSQMNGMTVTIASPISGDDLTHGSVTGGISVQSDTGTTLVFSGNANKATYQTLLQTIAFVAGGDQPGTTRSVTATVLDTSGGTSLPVTATISITAVNDAPVLSANTNPSVAEQATVTLFLNATITDPDSTSLTRLEAIISSPLTGDTFTYTPQVGLTVTVIPGNLTATGTATVAIYQALLSSLIYSPSSDVPGSSRIITVKVDDDTAVVSAPLVASVTINQVNDAPMISPPTSTPAVTEQQSTALFPLASISDVDSTTITRLEISISGPVTGDTLGFIAQTGITMSGSNGSLIASGAAALSVYQALLRSVTYTPDSNNPGLSRTITAKVKDSTDVESAVATAMVTITPVNDPPILSPMTTPTANEQVTVSLFPSGTIVDPDSANLVRLEIAITATQVGDTLAVAAGFTAPTGMTLNVSPASIVATGTAPVATYQSLLRAITFKADTDVPNGPRIITATATDEANLASVGLIATVTITAINDPPVITSATTTPSVDEGAAIVLYPSAVLSDDGADLNRMEVVIDNEQSTDVLAFVDVGVIAVARQSNGDLIATGTAPLASYQTLLRSITFQANGNNPGVLRVVKATVRDIGSTTSAQAVATIAITPVNDLPTTPSTPLQFTVDEEQPLTLNFDQLDDGISDPDGTTPSLRVASVVTGTLATLVGGVTTPVVPGTTVLSPGQQLVWTPGTNFVDELGATTFTLSAWDGMAASVAARPIEIRVIHRIDIAGFVGGLAYNLDSGRLRLASAATMMTIDPADRSLVSIDRSRLVATLSGGSVGEDIISLSSNAGAGLVLASGSVIKRGIVDVASYSLETLSVTITFNASATVDDVENASRLLVYDNAFGDSGSLATRTVSLVFAENSRPVSNTLSRAIQVLAPNRPPEIVLGTSPNDFKVQPNSSAVIQPAHLQARDGDTPPTAPVDLIFKLLSAPAYGTLRVDNGGILTPLLINGEFTQADIDAGKVSYLHRGGTIPIDSVGLQVRERGLNGLVSNSVTFLITIGVPRGAGIISDPKLVAVTNQEFTHTISFVGLSGGTPPSVLVADDATAAHLGQIQAGTDGVNFDWIHTFTNAGDVDVTISATVGGQVILQPMRIRVVNSLTPNAGG